MEEKDILDETKECFAKGQQLLGEGKTLQAKIEFNHALDLQSEKLGSDHESVALCFVQVAMCDLVSNDFEKANVSLKKALDIYLKKCDYNSQEIANCYYLLGSTNMQLKNFEEASLDFGHVVIISSNIFGPSSEECAAARSVYNKAMLLYKPEKPTEADIALDNMTDDEECYKKGSDYFDNAITYLAVRYFEKAISLREAKGITEDKKLVDYYRALAIAYTEADMQDNALEKLERLLTMCINLFGEESTEVAGTYNFLGYNNLIKENYDVAIDYLKKMLNINIKLHGEKDTEVIRNYAMLSSVYRMNGDIDNSLANAIIVEGILLSIGGESVEPDLLKCYGDMASIYHSKADFEKSLEYLRKEVKLAIKLHGENNETVLQIYNEMAHTYHHLGREEEVDALIAKMDGIYAKLQQEHEHHHHDHGDGCTCDCCDHEHHHH